MLINPFSISLFIFIMLKSKYYYYMLLFCFHISFMCWKVVSLSRIPKWIFFQQCHSWQFVISIFWITLSMLNDVSIFYVKAFMSAYFVWMHLLNVLSYFTMKAQGNTSGKIFKQNKWLKLRIWKIFSSFFPLSQ